VTIGVGTVAFSGSREIPDGALETIRGVVRAVSARLYVTGACIGVDQAIAGMVAKHWPTRNQRIVVPRNRTRVDEVWLATFGAAHERVAAAFMPRGTTYRERNLAMLGEGFVGVAPVVPDLLVAFPAYPQGDPRSARSGTWMTVRLARARGIRTHVYTLSEATTLA